MSLGDARAIPEFPGRPFSATPGCYFCGSPRQSDHGGVIDTGHNVHMEGRVHICFSCVDYLTSLRGGASPATIDRMKEQNEALRASNRSLGSSLKAAQKGMEAAQDANVALQDNIKVLKAQR